MNILIPTHAFTDQPQSGLHNVIWHSAIELAKAGCTVDIITTHLNLHDHTIDSLKKENIHIHHIAQFPVHNLNKTVALRCFVSALYLRLQRRFDWIFVVDTSKTPFAHWKLGAKFATRLLAPADEHTQQIFSKEDWANDRQRKDAEEGWEGRKKPLWYKFFSLLSEWYFWLFPVPQTHTNADVIFCLGKDTYLYWKDRLNAEVVFINHGIAQEDFAIQQPKPRETTNFVFLFVGRIVKRKGVFYLLEAFQHLRKSQENVELWLVGKGSTELVNVLQQYIKKDPEHIFYFGEVQKKQMGRFYKNCNALVDPMLFQAQSNVCLESLSFGKPVIAHKDGGTKDVVRHGSEGFLVNALDTKQLAQHMMILCENEEEYKKLSKQAQLRAHEFSWEKVAKTVLQSFTAFT